MSNVSELAKKHNATNIPKGGEGAASPTSAEVSETENTTVYVTFSDGNMKAYGFGNSADAEAFKNAVA